MTRYANMVCSDCGHGFVMSIKNSVRVVGSNVDPTTRGILPKNYGHSLCQPLPAGYATCG